MTYDDRYDRNDRYEDDYQYQDYQDYQYEDDYDYDYPADKRQWLLVRALRALSGTTTDPATAAIPRLAVDLGLAVTGSSDYHGENKTIGLGDELTDEAEFDKLVSAATGVEVLGR